jgi:hypothetical protein
MLTIDSSAGVEPKSDAIDDDEIDFPSSDEENEDFDQDNGMASKSVYFQSVYG